MRLHQIRIRNSHHIKSALFDDKSPPKEFNRDDAESECDNNVGWHDFSVVENSILLPRGKSTQIEVQIRGGPK